MTADPRDALIDAFIPKGAVRHRLAGDASFRSYERIEFDAKTLILMNAPPEKENVRPFVAIARYLESRGLSAPRIEKPDLNAGLLLLEDFGDDLYTRVLAREPFLAFDLYRAAVDVLTHLHGEKPEQTLPLGWGENYALPSYDQDLLFKELFLFPEWYLRALSDQENPEWEAQLREIWKPLFETVVPGNGVLTLRDYHADNLMWLPGRKGVAGVGLLDFQDAVLGHPAYDLVSLLQDARRPYDPDLEQAMIDHYLATTPLDLDRDAFLTAYQILGAQRNAKIIGIFTRLWRRDGKAQYPKMIPHVWTLLEENLKHPALAGAAKWFEKVAPKEKRPS